VLRRGFLLVSRLAGRCEKGSVNRSLVPSTPIETFRNGQVSLQPTISLIRSFADMSYLHQLYSPIDLHKSNLFPKARRGAKPPLLGPPAPLAKRSDPFYILDVNPINETTNHKLVSAYVTQMGKIKTRAETGLTWKNQRRVGKMVRRARAMGLISRWDNNLSRDYTP
jgi:ribosomal protein S18